MLLLLLLLSPQKHNIAIAIARRRRITRHPTEDVSSAIAAAEERTRAMISHYITRYTHETRERDVAVEAWRRTDRARSSRDAADAVRKLRRFIGQTVLPAVHTHSPVLHFKVQCAARTQTANALRPKPTTCSFVVVVVKHCAATHIGSSIDTKHTFTHTHTHTRRRRLTASQHSKRTQT